MYHCQKCGKELCHSDCYGSYPSIFCCMCHYAPADQTKIAVQKVTNREAELDCRVETLRRNVQRAEEDLLYAEKRLSNAKREIANLRGSCISTESIKPDMAVLIPLTTW